MTDAKIAAFRLRRHHLGSASHAGAIGICRDVCGVQAQLLTAAYMQIHVRDPEVTRAEIEAALWDSRTLVRTSLMRQTLHIIPVDEFALYIAALQTSRVAAVLRVMARCGIAAAESDALADLIVRTLADGPMTGAAIRAAVRPRVSSRVRSWMDKVSSIVRVPVSRGLVCYGSGEGNAVKFIRVDQWLATQRPIAEREAQCFLLRKYLRAYGPANARDFAYWSGIAAKDCARVFEDLKPECTEIPGYGMLLSSDTSALASSRAVSGLKLLPAFDPFLLGHHGKDHLVDPRYYKQVYRNQGWISPVILRDGRLVGTWSHKMERGRCVVATNAWEPVPAKGLAMQAAAVAAFMTRPL